MRWRETMRRDCRRFVRDLRLPPADSIRELLPAVEERTGHPIRLTHAPLGSGQGVCGLWIRTVEGVDHIFVNDGTSRAHQDHIIAHEVAHILCNHHLRDALRHPGPAALRPADTAVLGRTGYAQRAEREAELIGSYLQHHVHRPGPRAAGQDEDRMARTLLRAGG